MTTLTHEMKKFKIEFTGRRRGAIGVYETFIETVEATSLEAARIGLYDNYDHITIYSVNGDKFYEE